MVSNDTKSVKKTSIGGQALIEGVMMRGVSKGAMAIRHKDGSIEVSEWEIPEKKWYEKTPILRGSVNFVKNLKDGYKCLAESIEKSDIEEDDEEPSKLDKWLTEKLGDKLTGVIMGISMVFGIAMAVVLFLLVPSYLFSFIEMLVPADISAWRTIFEGILKIAIFVGYMALVSMGEGTKRLYSYHGAEHKTIFCYESGEDLTVENVRKFKRFHPRCGTSFIIITLMVSILVYSVVPITPEMFKEWLGIESGALAVMLRTIAKLILLPLVVGIAYELIKLAGRYDNFLTRILSAPGLWMQRITTNEPDDSMIETAIAALEPVLPKEGEDDNW